MGLIPQARIALDPTRLNPDYAPSPILKNTSPLLEPFREPLTEPCYGEFPGGGLGVYLGCLGRAPGLGVHLQGCAS